MGELLNISDGDGIEADGPVASIERHHVDVVEWQISLLEPWGRALVAPIERSWPVTVCGLFSLALRNVYHPVVGHSLYRQKSCRSISPAYHRLTLCRVAKL